MIDPTNHPTRYYQKLKTDFNFTGKLFETSSSY
jgi:hypothetical protein